MGDPMTAKRICVLTTSYPRTDDADEGIFLKRLVEAYSQKGGEGVVIVPLDNHEPPSVHEGNFTVLRYRYGIFTKGRLAFGSGIMPNIRANRALALQIPGLLFFMVGKAWSVRKHFDVIHANWIGAGIAAWALSLLTKKPYFITLRGEDVKLLKIPVLGTILQSVLKYATGVISVNDEFLRDLILNSSIPPERCHLIPNGITLRSVTREEGARLRNEFKISSHTPLLSFIGTIIPRKRVEILIDLLSYLPRHHLALAGRCSEISYLESLKSKISDLKLQDRVSFLGALPPSQVPVLLAESDAYLSASQFEGRSNSVLEALASGTVVCLSSIPSHREIVSETSGILFDTSSDLAVAAKKLELLLGDPHARATMIENAQKSVAPYTWDRTASSYLSLLFRTV